MLSYYGTFSFRVLNKLLFMVLCYINNGSMSLENVKVLTTIFARTSVLNVHYYYNITSQEVEILI